MPRAATPCRYRPRPVNDTGDDLIETARAVNDLG
jgi:hypothetical protein